MTVLADSGAEKNQACLEFLSILLAIDRIGLKLEVLPVWMCVPFNSTVSKRTGLD